MIETLPQLSLSLLGPFSCLVDGQDVSSEFRTRKERALFAYLAVESDRKHQRNALGEVFWPGKPEGYARMNLRQALSGIRRAIECQDHETSYLLISDEYVRFETQRKIEVDCKLFNDHYETTSSHNHQNIETCPTCVNALDELITLYRGEFLEDFYLPNVQEFQEWALFHRENYFRRLLSALHVLINYYQNSGQIDTALEYAYRQANLAPLEESAHRQLMMLLALDGRRSAAMEQYQLCCRILSDELVVNPDIETIALYEKIKAGLIFNAHPPITKPNNTNLPVQFTKFIGRDKEVAWALETIKDPMARLLAILGISGVGKTRFAIQLAAKLINEFPDGVWFIPLYSIHNVDLIPKEIAQILRINLGDSDPRRVLLRALAPQQALLIIDNFEHLLEGTTLLLEILREAPGIKIIVTSQRRLSYQATSTLELKGLPCPHEDDPNWKDTEAVDLFITRAKQNLPDFKITDQDIPHLIQICKIVNGLPLGLELAAAGLRFYSCEDIAKGIQQNINILQTTLLDIPERHRSIRAAFDYSWSMLPETEQDVYRRLSVFQGEFSIDEAIATTGATFAEISNLVDRSLIQRNASGSYLIQPILRLYAAEKLESVYDFEDNDSAFYGSETVDITRDPLTKLPNKVLFRDLFRQSLAIAIRRSHLVALVIIEINQIEKLPKIFNRDKYNSIIVEIAEILSNSVRESDIVAHLLPGKYAILLGNITKYQDGALVTNKIQKNVEHADISCTDGTKVDLKMGISVFPTDSKDIAELFRFANIALSQAKLTKENHRYYSH